MGDRHPLTGEATKSAGRFPPRPSVARKQIAEASEQLEQLRAQHDGGGYSPEQQRVLQEKMETLRQRKAALQPTPHAIRFDRFSAFHFFDSGRYLQVQLLLHVLRLLR